MTAMDLTRLLRPRSIAVVGATPRSFVGRIAVENCKARRFGGSVVGVNPKYERVGGSPCVPALSALSEPPDVVLAQVATSRVLDVVAEAVELGTRAFVIPGGGFTDSGHEALDLVAGLRQLTDQTPIRVVGPNCMGFVDFVTGAAPYVGTVPPQVRRGRVAAVAQSGAVIEALVNCGGRVPLSSVVSTGSEAITGMPEFLRFFAGDPQTDSVLAFVEGFDDPVDFLSAARELAQAGKRLAVCMVGRSGVAQAGVSAHSGKLAPPFDVAAAALEQAGAVIADDLDELLAFGEVFGSGRRVRGPRLHVVTNSGGEANLIADLASDAGLELPPMSDAAVERLKADWPRFHVSNPLDPWGAGDYEEIYPAALATVAHEPGDIMMVSIDQQQHCGQFEKRLGRDLATYLSEHAGDRLPVFVSPTSQDPDPGLVRTCREGGVPLLRGARTACAVLGKLAVASLVEPASPATAPRSHPLLARPRTLSEAEALEALAFFGVRVPRSRVVDTPADAVAAAREIGATVVLKAVAAGLYHKSEHRLVELGLTGDDQVTAAACRIEEAAGRAGIEHIRYLVMEQADGLLDVYVGFKRDRQFGPTFLVGLGGIWTEFLSDVAIHVGHLDAAAARALVDRSAVGAMMRGARGGSLDSQAVVQTLTALAEVVASAPGVDAIDVNPLMVGRHGAVAVDAVIETTGPKEEPTP
jgi:acyl-CoA synthetase (NDP forming)